MVVSLVRTAIQTKCRYDNARMTGNYEKALLKLEHSLELRTWYFNKSGGC